MHLDQKNSSFTPITNTPFSSILPNRLKNFEVLKSLNQIEDDLLTNGSNMAP